ncbi:MAG: 50S ribosomal protein L24 [Candidatus Marsarchaeota archaeon]|nr:50S ribosomal protein L24 [Candidatus Marsarchaeota archaeon]MCL5413127.1 50S ribosomal protein L24 [Candidatus Marsarchaeota archaeon]
MIRSSKPRKQRKFRFTAPMHVRQNFVNVHISKELSSRLGIKRRSIEVRKGDTVRIMSGDSKGKSGKVSEVRLRTGKILIEGIIKKDAKGKEKQIPVQASNVYLSDIDTSDKLRKAGVDAAFVKQKSDVNGK